MIYESDFLLQRESKLIWHEMHVSSNGNSSSRNASLKLKLEVGKLSQVVIYLRN